MSELGSRLVYDRIVGTSLSPALSMIANRIPPCSRVLDVACASGYFGQNFRGSTRCVVTGVDYSREAVEVARRRGLEAHALDLEREPSRSSGLMSSSWRTCSSMSEIPRRFSLRSRLRGSSCHCQTSRTGAVGEKSFADVSRATNGVSLTAPMYASSRKRPDSTSSKQGFRSFGKRLIHSFPSGGVAFPVAEY